MERAEKARKAELRAAQCAAIETVLQSRLNARAPCRLGNVFNPSGYVKLIQQIDTERCPLSFREAWLDYVHAWERNVERPSGDGALTSSWWEASHWRSVCP